MEWKRSQFFNPTHPLSHWFTFSFFFLPPHFLASHPTAAPLLPPNGRFTLFINEHTLHWLLMVLGSPNFRSLWFPNSIFLPEEGPPASIFLSGSELWAPYLILATAVGAACRSPPCQPFFPAFLFPLTFCSCSQDRLYSGSSPPSAVVGPVWAGANEALQTCAEEKSRSMLSAWPHQPELCAAVASLTFTCRLEGVAASFGKCEGASSVKRCPQIGLLEINVSWGRFRILSTSSPVAFHFVFSLKLCRHIENRLWIGGIELHI